MIRNVVLVRLKPGVDPAHIDALFQALEEMPAPGRTAFWMGRDAGLREGNMDLAIIGDFVDEAAYRAYDADERHNEIRRTMIAPIAESVERCQIVI
jgi:hypothetical protein